MAEHASEFEWRREGEEAEIVVFAPDEARAERGLERALPFARLPGALNPVFAAASEEGLGCVVASSSHVSPDLFSTPERGTLLVVEAAGVGRPSAADLTGLVTRELSMMRLPSPSEAWIQHLCEQGARAAAEDGLLKEEDLSFFSTAEGDPDALGGRAISAGVGGWRESPGEARAFEMVEVLDSDAVADLGVERGSLVLVLRSGAGELGSIAQDAHRRRIRARVDEFGVEASPVAAPRDSGETWDLLAATGAAANLADGRMALLIHAARRAILESAGEARICAAWRIGGLQNTAENEAITHRARLAAVGEGRALVSISSTGGVIGCGTGNMYASAPVFGVEASGGRDVWEEAGIFARWARIEVSEDGG